MSRLDDPAGPPRAGAVRASAAGNAMAAMAAPAGGHPGDRHGEPDDPGKHLHTAPIEGDASGPQARAPAKVIDKNPDDPYLGTTIAGRYRIEARLGEGGMGAVYRVEHTHMRKKMALKVLHREMTGQSEIVARFEREAMAAAHIDHPNVAGATDFGKLDDGSFYLVLEYVEGTSLRTLIEKGPLAPHRAVHVTAQILFGLKRAHELGIVHRDLKPENVLLVDKDGDADFVKVLDFGIARVPIGSLGGGDAGPSLTRAGMVYGTPEYMAPEQALGQGVDGRSDIYGTGVMLFEMITGRRPYDNKDKVALLGQHVAGAIPSLRERAPQLMLPAELEVVVTKLLQKSPADRYDDAQSAIDALLSLDLGGPTIMVASRNPSRSAASSAERSGDWPSRKSGSMAVASASADPAPAVTHERPLPTGVPAESAPNLDTQGARKLPAVIYAMGAAAVVIIVVLIVLLSGKKGSDDASNDARRPATSSGPASPGSAPSASPTTSVDFKASADKAMARVDGGDVEGGIADLVALTKDAPSDPLVLLDLAKAQSKGKHHMEALGALKKLVSASPESASDPAVGAIIDAALPSSADTVFGLLEDQMGAQGTPILFDIGYGTRGPAGLRDRARKVLAQPEVQANVTPAIRGALEVAKATGCEPKKAAIEKYRKDFDARVLPLLRPLQTATGCGSFFKNKDCWPCLHAAKYLDTVIKEIEARTKATK